MKIPFEQLKRGIDPIFTKKNHHRTVFFFFLKDRYTKMKE